MKEVRARAARVCCLASVVVFGVKLGIDIHYITLASRRVEHIHRDTMLWQSYLPCISRRLNAVVCENSSSQSSVPLINSGCVSSLCAHHHVHIISPTAHHTRAYKHANYVCRRLTLHRNNEHGWMPYDDVFARWISGGASLVCALVY